MMTEMLTPYLFYIGLVLVAALAVVCVTLWLKTKKMNMQLRHAQQELSHEVQGMSKGAMGVGRRMLELEQKVQSLEAKLTEFQKNDPAKVSYSEAAKLVDMGAEVEDLMECCSISRPEAELVSALTRSKQEKQREERVPTLTPDFL